MLFFLLLMAGEVRLDSGLDLHYQTWGERGPVVLLVAGWGNRLEVWEPLAESLKDRYRLVAFDARGIGRSDDSDDAYTVATMANEAAQLMARLGHRRYHLAGLSLGSFVAQKLAVSQPDRIDRLVLIATSLGGPQHVAPQPEVLQYLMKSASMPIEQATREGMKFALHPRFLTNQAELVEGIIQARIKQPPSAHTLARQAQAAMFSDHGKDAASLLQATLIIHGKQDQLVPLANAERVHRALPNSQLLILNESGHVVIIDNTEAVAKAMGRFLRSSE